MAVVVDDRVLLDFVVGRPPAVVVQERQDGVYTTSSWYYRLGRAVFGGSGSGSLSGRLATLGDHAVDQVRSTLVSLPTEVGLLHPRAVVPVMFTLRVRRQLNLLSAEALAVAILAGARLVVSTHAPLLAAAAEELGLDVHVVG